MSNEKVKVVKKLRFGERLPDGNIYGKANPNEDIDLGLWCGEIGQIRSIELEKEIQPQVDAKINEDIEAKKADEAWIRQPVEQKARHYEYFKIYWSSRHEFKKVEIPQEVLDKVYQIQLEYFQAHPDVSIVPSENFNSIFSPNVNPKTLAEKMNVNIDDIPA